jgi:hypothetical protein
METNASHIHKSTEKELKSLANTCQDPLEILDFSDQVAHELFEARDADAAERITAEASHLYFEAMHRLAENRHGQSLAA